MKAPSFSNPRSGRSTVQRLTWACLLLLAVPTSGLANTFVVNSTNDPGDGVCNTTECTLREALTAANANPGPDVIAFDIPGTGVRTIRPLTQLPAITEALTVDGTTQPGFAGLPLIELDGSLAVADSPGAAGLRLEAGGCEVRGLVVNRFAFCGIFLAAGDGSRIAGNFLGTDAAGAVSLGNGSGGSILVSGGSNGHRIGGTVAADRNVISPVGTGINCQGGERLVIQGNYIGTDVTGTTALANPTGLAVYAGIDLRGADCQVGGPGTGEGNLISGCRGPNPSEWWRNGAGIVATAPGSLIQGNRVGTDATGMLGIPNELGINAGGTDMQIGGTEPGAGNLISGNGFHGLSLGSRNTAQGNLIGTDITGLAVLPNGGIGIGISGSDNLVGGFTPEARNLISGNTGYGLTVGGGGAVSNRIVGNWIGVDITGTNILGNNGSEPAPCGTAIYLFSDADENIVGGAEPGAGNVISGNHLGLFIVSSRNKVQGNLIGTDPTGTISIRSGNGIDLRSPATANLIGGTEAGAGNVVSSATASQGRAISILGSSANRVLGNRIGTDITGALPFPNLLGLGIWGASDNIIGGEGPNEGNVIAFSLWQGVEVNDDSSTNNTIRGNSIHSNGATYGGLGLDLGGAGVHANDERDYDPGPNRLQNYPVLAEALVYASHVTVHGRLDSAPSSGFELDFYANESCHPSGHGEGQVYLGSLTVTTDAAGTAAFQAMLPAVVPAGRSITATATDAAGNTSEFSACAVTTTGWPEVVSALTAGNLTGLTVRFSRPLEETAALTTANYAVSGGVTVQSVTLLDPQTVRLNTTLIPEGQAYTLTVSGLQDVLGGLMPTPQDQAFLQTQGGITRFEYHDIPGYLIEHLTASPKFPDQPDVEVFTPLLEAPLNVRDNYGVVFRGYVTPPVSGDYTFYVSSDDQGDLWLSTDDDPANKTRIAQEPGWNPSRSWISGTTQHLRVPPPPGIFDGALFIEAEDFDFDGGQFVQDRAIGMTGAYSGGAYAGRGAVAEVDYHDPDANESPIYRASTQGVATAADTAYSRGGFEVQVNYVIGWNNVGDWYNYTRRFPEPAQAYHAYAQLSSGGADIAAQLDEITAGTFTANQTTAKLGEFRAHTTSNWGAYHLVPLLDDGGGMAAVTLGGIKTLRFTVLPGDLNVDYLLFKPVATDTTTLADFRPLNQSAPVPLVAGQKYYLEARMKEAGGGENLAVTWQMPGDPAPANGAPPIPAEYLSGVSVLEPVQITGQPQAQTTSEFGTANFSMTATGAPPLTHQWFKDEVAIPGATNASLTLEQVPFADDGALIHVVVVNGISAVRSAAALLTVMPDLTPPTILSVRGSPTFDRITIRFSEPVRLEDASNPIAYDLGGELGLLRVQADPDGLTVVLFTSPQTQGRTYTVTAGGIRDRAATPNMLASGTQAAFTAFALVEGFLLREFYSDIAGVALSTFTNNSKFPDWPDLVGYVPEFASPRNFADNYGVRLSGYLVPPETGDYRFYLAANGAAALFLSTDDQPGNLRLIAHEPWASGYRDWTGLSDRNPEAPQNRSELISLETGRLYYVEALVKARVGDDHLGVAWQPPGEPEPARWDPPIPGAYLRALATTDDAIVSITQYPEHATVREGDSVAFRVRVATDSDVVTYQWQRNGADIPGACFADYQHVRAASDEDGAAFRCVVRVPGAEVVSDEATLLVEPDTEPPVPVAAEGSIGRMKVTLEFSEPLNPSDAANPASYVIDGGLAVERAKLVPNGRTVVLYTSPQTEGQEYRVSFNNLRDTAAAANAISIDTTIAFVAWVPEEFLGPFPSWMDARRNFGAVGDGVTDDTAALQAALDSIGWSGSGPWDQEKPCVLYLPAGTYRITSGLVFKYRISVSVIGEDPETTWIVWDGPEGGTMLHCNGVGYHRVSRLTFDGAGRAYSGIDHIWDGTNQPNATSGSEYSDLIIRDVQFGIRGGGGAGANDAEVSVLRCQFLRCADSGISMGSYNAVDWWAWHCRFEDCGLGVTNARYAGACHVYDSLFLRSKVSDLMFGNCAGYFSFRRNTSIESAAFYLVGWIGCAGNLTFQGNTIIDPTRSAPIAVFSLGPVLLLDNVIRSRAEVTQGPVVSVWDNLIAIGNTFTVPSPLAAIERAIAFDNRIVARDELEWDEPELPGFLPHRDRQVFEIPTGADSAVIQAAIDEAAALAGQRPVVHFPPGTYRVDQTLVVPPHSDVQLVGDGFLYASMLNWQSATEGAVLRLAGPSRATLRGLTIGGGARGIVIDRCDQPGSRLFGEQVGLTGSQRHNLWIDRLRHLTVDLTDSGYGFLNGSDPSVLVVGGTQLDGATTRGVRLFGGSGGLSPSSFEVFQGGQLLVQDVWFEGGTTFLRLIGDGRFTLHGAFVAPLPQDAPALLIDAFQGQIAFLTTLTFSPNNRLTNLRIENADAGLEALFLGIQGQPGFFQNHAPAADIRLLLPMEQGPTGGTVPIPGQGDADPAFLRRLLAHTRESRPSLVGPVVAGATDVRIYGVHLQAKRDGLYLTDENTSPPRFRPVAPPTVVEGETVILEFAADDADLPYTHLTYALEGAVPFGASLDRQTGRLTWRTDETVGPGVYELTVTVTDDGSPALQDRITVPVTVTESNQAPQLGLPGVVPFNQPFVVTDLDTRLPASSLQDLGNGNYDFSGWGGWFWTDTCSFAHQTVTGDFDVRVRLESIEMHTVDTAAGLVVRELLEPGSRMFCLVGRVGGMGIDGRESNDVLLLIERPQRNGDSRGWGPTTTEGAPYPNRWVRIRREGQTFIAYRSGDGESWEEITRTTVSEPFPQTLYVGLGVSAGVYDRPSLARFRDYENLVTGLVAIPDQAVDEGEELMLELLAGDPDLPLQTLTFSLDPGAPEGATIDPVTGVFAWTPSEPQGPGIHPVTVRVTDNGEPPLSDALTFAITVNEVNAAPVVEAVADPTVEESTPLTFTVSANDSNDAPANAVVLSVSGLPAGASFDPATGVFAWTPGEAQGPGTFEVTFTATDDGTPPLSVTQSTTITVLEVNQPPALEPVPDQVVNPGQRLDLQLQAQDPDLPTNALQFAQLAGPADAIVDPLIGLWSWTPPPALAGQSSDVTLEVRDDAPSPFVAQTRFSVRVRAVQPDLTSSSLAFTTEGFQFSFQAETGLRFTLEASDDLAAWIDLETVTVGEQGSATFADPTAMTTPNRFYRLRWDP